MPGKGRRSRARRRGEEKRDESAGSGNALYQDDCRDRTSSSGDLLSSRQKTIRKAGTSPLAGSASPRHAGPSHSAEYENDGDRSLEVRKTGQKGGRENSRSPSAPRLCKRECWKKESAPLSRIYLHEETHWQ